MEEGMNTNGIRHNIPHIVRKEHGLTVQTITREIAGVHENTYYVHVYDARNGSERWIKEGAANIWANIAVKIGTHAGIAISRSSATRNDEDAENWEDTTFPFGKDIRTVITNGKDYVGIRWDEDYGSVVLPRGRRRAFSGFWKIFKSLRKQGKIFLEYHDGTKYIFLPLAKRLSSKQYLEHTNIAGQIRTKMAKKAVRNRQTLERWLK